MNTHSLHTDTPPHDNLLVQMQTTGDPTQAVILCHGRFASGADMMNLVGQLDVPENTLVLAPTASGNQWYPNRFIVERDDNQPQLDSALEVIGELIRFCRKEYEITSDQITLVGFSQGACLVTDFISRNPQPFKAVGILSGGLIGADWEIADTDFTGSLEDTPVYLGCDEADPHIPYDRVEVTNKVLTSLEADLESCRYQDLGHSVHPDAIAFLNKAVSKEIG